MAYCLAWLNGWIYQQCLALDIQWQLVSFEYVNQLLEFTQYLQAPPGSKKVSDLTYFWKYFSLNNPGQTDQLPKYLMYISHDEIIGAFFRALTSPHIKGAKPASDLYVEFYRPAGSQQGGFL